MTDSIAIILLFVVAAYFALGFCFALGFIFRGVEAIDPAAVHAPLGFRFILVPGAAALWPLLLRQWIHKVKEAKP